MTAATRDQNGYMLRNIGLSLPLNQHSIMISIRKTNMKCSALENKTNACREWASERGDLITVDNCLRVDLVIKLTPKTFSFNI